MASAAPLAAREDQALRRFKEITRQAERVEIRNA
jgi:hypothetical protein